MTQMTKKDVETGDMSEKTSSAKTGYIGIFYLITIVS